jgi:hypothetical protein
MKRDCSMRNQRLARRAVFSVVLLAYMNNGTGTAFGDESEEPTSSAATVDPSDSAESTATTREDPATSATAGVPTEGTSNSAGSTTTTSIDVFGSVDEAHLGVVPTADRREGAIATGEFTVTVSPNSGLRDGQEVTVDVSGTPPNQPLFVFECNRPDPPTTPTEGTKFCVFAAGKYLSSVPADSSGHLSTAFTVFRGTHNSLGNEVTIGDTAYLFVSDTTGANGHAEIRFSGATDGGQTATTTTTAGGGSVATTTNAGSATANSNSMGERALADTGATSWPLVFAGSAMICVGAVLTSVARRRRRAANRATLGC